jgi:hypothetical protein
LEALVVTTIGSRAYCRMALIHEEAVQAIRIDTTRFFCTRVAMTTWQLIKSSPIDFNARHWYVRLFKRTNNCVLILRHETVQSEIDWEKGVTLRFF